MLKKYLARPIRRPGGSAGRLGVGAMIVAFSAGLAGCAGSSGSVGFGNAAGAKSAAFADASGGGAGEEAGLAANPANAAVHSRAVLATAAKFTAGGTPGSGAYKIGPLDVLDISVFKVPDLSKIVQVGDNGNITYPLVGEIPAVGKTAHEVERELEQKLGAKYIRSPQVTVLVKEYNSQRVTVEGSVKNPGVYPMKGRTSLVQALAMAGGVDSTVSSGDIVVFRTVDGKRSAARFDFDAITQGSSEDPDLDPGDVVVADTSTTKVALHNILSVLPLATATAIFVPLM